MPRIVVFLITAMLLLPVAARAEGVYYDLAKVHADCADSKAAADALKTDEAKWNGEIGRAADDAKKAADACAKTAGQPIAGKTQACQEAEAKERYQQQILAQYQQLDQQRANANYQQIDARVKRILPVIARARHLSAIVPVGGAAAFVSPALDVTADIVRRLDAGEGKDEEQLRAENAKLQKEKGEAEARLKAALDAAKMGTKEGTKK